MWRNFITGRQTASSSRRVGRRPGRRTECRIESLESRQLLSSVIGGTMSIDAAFGNNGIISTPMTATGNSGVAIESDGKILLAGADGGGASYLTRLNPDGSMDTSFGNHGVAQVATGLGAAGILPEFVLIQPDGKIVVGLTGGISGPSIIPVGGTLHRFNPDGSLDTSFGNGGQVAALSGQIEGLALAPDGAIIVGGEDLVTSNSTRIVIARVKADGSIDSGFGQNGVAAIPSGTSIEKVQVTPDDKILVGGFNYSGTPNTLLTDFVYRFNANGTADTTFDASSIATTGGTGMFIEDMTVLPDGTLLVLKFNSGLVALTRCNYDGSLDTNFGTGGTVSDEGGGTFMIGAYRIQLRSTGEIVVEGDGTNAVYCGHFTPDGKLLQSDTTSTHNGWDPFSQQPLPNPTPTPLPDRYLFGGAIDTDGKLVVAGTGYAARLNSDGYVWSGDPNFRWAPYPSPATLAPPPVVTPPVVAPVPVDQPTPAPQAAPLSPTAQVAMDHVAIQSARATLKTKLTSLKGQLSADIAAFWKAHRPSHQSAQLGRTAQAAVTGSLSAGAIRHAIKQDRQAIHAARHSGFIAIAAAKRKLGADVKIMHHSKHP